jgi:hypothetical protein
VAKASPEASQDVSAEPQQQPSAQAEEVEGEDSQTPSMAPPLRRRRKKRGFFKRLFGIK